MRSFDDRVVYALNTSIPTDSFSGKVNAKEKCKELFEELMKAHKQRDSTIKQCVHQTQTKVEELRNLRKADMDNIDILQKLRKEQSTLRQMQSELMVEEVVNKQSLKVFTERCRIHYIPTDIPS